MQTTTTRWRWLGVLFMVALFAAPSAFAQRTVTLVLNTATIPDTTLTTSFIEVRGAANGTAPATLADGNIIDWSNASTLEPVNIGGDYWRVQFQIADTTDLTFKFYSQQAQDILGEGWEADPNPNIAPGSGDVTLPVHYFEANREYRGHTGDRGPYDWRPWESKQDSVAVWFRVAMFGENARQEGYDPAKTAPQQQIGVRGDNLGGASPIDWGATNVVLTRESNSGGVPGQRIYSGVAYYPESAAGSVQNYKFVIDNENLGDGNLGWEDGNLSGANRSFTVPANDTTLHWVYFGNTAPSTVEPVQSAVIFSVDLTPLKAIGVFDEARGDTLEVRGEFNGWDCDNPDDCLLLAVPGEPQFEQAVSITTIPGKEMNYKFFLNINDAAFKQQFGVETVPSGWEEPISTTGANRTFVFEGNAGGFQDLGVQFFNDILAGNIMPAGASTEVTFRVDMTSALTAAEPFNPAEDSVMVEINDPIWLFTQGIQAEGSKRIPNFELTDPDGNGVYEGTFTVNGPTYGAIQYKYAYGAGTSFQQEEGGSTSGLGRRRTRYIPPNVDGSWPSSVTFPQETYKANGNLPFETNPVITAVEPIDGEVPSRIALEQNYPNPFNPTTTFEYMIPASQHVRLDVYDVMGRRVATLVDGVQPAATYRVGFDASHLSSGVYFYRLTTPAQVLTKKMTLVK